MASATSTIHVSGVDRREMASLKARAKAKGLSVEGYVKDLIDSDLSIAELARRKTIDQVFAPLQQQFEESGMSESELDHLVDAARKEHHRRVTRTKSR
jgi:hypothetical protein